MGSEMCIRDSRISSGIIQIAPQTTFPCVLRPSSLRSWTLGKCRERRDKARVEGPCKGWATATLAVARGSGKAQAFWPCSHSCADVTLQPPVPSQAVASRARFCRSSFASCKTVPPESESSNPHRNSQRRQLESWLHHAHTLHVQRREGGPGSQQDSTPQPGPGLLPSKFPAFAFALLYR